MLQRIRVKKIRFLTNVLKKGKLDNGKSVTENNPGPSNSSTLRHCDGCVSY